MTSLRFTVPGAPVPWSRPRPAFKRPGVYITSPKDRAHREAVETYAAAAHRGRKPLTGPLQLRASFVFEPPPSWKGRKRQDALDGVLPHTSRPDCSNLVKLVEDALQPTFIADDALVVSLVVSKCYGLEARTMVDVEELGR